MKPTAHNRIGRLAVILALGLLLAGQPLIAPPAAASEKEQGSCCGCKAGCSAPCKDRCGSSPMPAPREEKAPVPSKAAPERDLQPACTGDTVAGDAPEPDAPRRARSAGGHDPPSGPSSLLERKTSFLC